MASSMSWLTFDDCMARARSHSSTPNVSASTALVLMPSMRKNERRSMSLLDGSPVGITSPLTEFGGTTMEETRSIARPRPSPARHRSACASCRRASRSASMPRNILSRSPLADSSRSQRRTNCSAGFALPSPPGRGTSGRSRSGRRAPAASAQPRAVDGAPRRRAASRVPARNLSRAVRRSCCDSCPTAYLLAWADVGERRGISPTSNGTRCHEATVGRNRAERRA